MLREKMKKQKILLLIKYKKTKEDALSSKDSDLLQRWQVDNRSEGKKKNVALSKKTRTGKYALKL